MARALHYRPRVGPPSPRPFAARGGPRVRREAGFTLIEMMIVVVIVGVLATLAVVGYRKLVQSSHVTEATHMVQSIRVAQEAYHAETQQYADVSTSLTAFYPNASPTGKTVTAWGGACTSACNLPLEWNMLPIHADGPVMFGYATKAGPSNSNPATLPPALPAINLPTPSATDWYMVVASCDLDGLGGTNTYVLTTSWSNQVMTFFEGQ